MVQSQNIELTDASSIDSRFAMPPSAFSFASLMSLYKSLYSSESSRNDDEMFGSIDIGYQEPNGSCDVLKGEHSRKIAESVYPVAALLFL